MLKISPLYLVALCGALMATPAFAGTYGPRTVIGGVYHQTTTVQSRDQLNNATCDNATPGGSCDFVFRPVDKALIVEHVSCYIFTSGDVRTATLHARTASGALPIRYVDLVPTKTVAASLFTVVSGPVLFPLAAGERPQVTLDFGSTVSVGGWCSVAGHLVP